VSRPALVRSGPIRIHFCFPLKRSPDAATWHAARDVSQRAEPDVRPLGYATSTFSADKARRLSIPLAGGVPPQHLLRPVHSADRRRSVHSACEVPVHSTSSAVCPYCRMHYAHHYSHVTKEADAAYQYYVDCGHRDAGRLLRCCLH
jgi:hypothetical protein